MNNGNATVWNLDALSGHSVAGFPIEELSFAAAFGSHRAGVYEHLTRQRGSAPHVGGSAETSHG